MQFGVRLYLCSVCGWLSLGWCSAKSIDSGPALCTDKKISPQATCSVAVAIKVLLLPMVPLLSLQQQEPAAATGRPPADLALEQGLLIGQWGSL